MIGKQIVDGGEGFKYLGFCHSSCHPVSSSPAGISECSDASSVDMKQLK